MATRRNKSTIIPAMPTDAAPVATQAGDVQAVPSTAIAAIRDAIMQCVPHVIDAKDAKAAVSEANKLASKGADDTDVSTRKGIYINLAEISRNAGYTEAHIEAGAKAAVTAYAETRNATLTSTQTNTLNTFAGECKRVMHPAVREHVREAYTTCERLWAAEGAALEADPDNAPTPYRDAFKKCDFMVKNANGFLGAYVHKDAEVRKLAGNAEALAQHVIRARGVDPKANAKMIARAVEMLDGVLVNFPDEGFRGLVAQIAAIDADRLRSYVKVRDAKAHAANPLPAKVHNAKGSAGAVPSPVTAAAAAAATEDLLDTMELKNTVSALAAQLAAITKRFA